MAMEERLGPPPADDRASLQIALSRGSINNNTYIVQMPKDQIYRVPPPENAAFVERHRQPPQKSPRRRSCSPCACYTVSALFFAALIALVGFLIYKLTLTPQNPLFLIQSFSIDGNNKRGRAHHAQPTYHVGIQTTNPNGFNSLVYALTTAELVFNGKGVAKGKSPAVTQAPKQIDEFEMELLGHGVVGKRVTKLRLKMSLNVKKKTWLRDHTDLVLLECDFVVDSLPRQKGSTVVKSQTCAYL